MENDFQNPDSGSEDIPEKRNHQSHRILFKIVLLSVSISIVVVFGEVALRIFKPQPLAGIMFAQDEKFGFWNRPNLRKKKFQSEPNTPFYAVSTDAKGYRGRIPVPLVKEPEARRIVVLGDSFTFGVGVENDETYPAQLRSLLAQYDIPDLQSGTKRFEVVNAGCPGWGTENELAFWKTRAEELDPDLLIIAFYRNDLADNMRHMLYKVQDGSPVYSPGKSLSRAKSITRWIPFYTFLSEHSHLANLFRRAAARLMVKAPAKDHGAKVAAVGRDIRGAKQIESASEFDSQLNVYSVLMEALLSDAKQKKVSVVFLQIAGRNECGENAPSDYVAVEKLSEKWLREGKIACVVNMREALKKELGEGKEIFIPGDGHLKAEGNRIVAKELVGKVLQTLKDK